VLGLGKKIFDKDIYDFEDYSGIKLLLSEHKLN
jgi:hypothetical protein